MVVFVIFHEKTSRLIVSSVFLGGMLSFPLYRLTTAGLYEGVYYHSNSISSADGTDVTHRPSCDPFDLATWR